MENIKQINIYLVDGSRYVVIPSDDNLAKYVKGNFYGGYNIGISKNRASSIIHEWVFNAERQHKNDKYIKDFKLKGDECNESK